MPGQRLAVIQIHFILVIDVFEMKTIAQEAEWAEWQYECCYCLQTNGQYNSFRFIFTYTNEFKTTTAALVSVPLVIDSVQRSLHTCISFGSAVKCIFYSSSSRTKSK